MKIKGRKKLIFMIKICSLEFLNKEFFDVDVMSKDGTVLFKSGDKISPELLLKLYFKELYSDKEPEEIRIPVVEPEEIKEPEILEELPKTEENIPASPLFFDEKKAQRISEYAVKIGELLEFSKEKSEELKKGAFYCKAALGEFSTKDLEDKNFKLKLANASYKIMKEELKLDEQIAETAKLYFKNYESKDLIIENKTLADTPYHHIVAIAECWEEMLSKNYTKEQAIEKMLKLGGNKFNIFVLHKFINMMREEK